MMATDRPEHTKETLRFRFTPVDSPRGDQTNPHAKNSTYLPEVIEALSREFGNAIREVTLYANEHTVLVETSRIVDICQFLKQEHGFDYLSDLGGIDRFTEEERFEVFYNLVSLQGRQRIRLKVRTHEENPVVPSIEGVYRAANWNERECFDMFGIRFEGLSDPRRIYLPEDFEHFPLRKEFPVLGIPGSLPLPPRRPGEKLIGDQFPAARGERLMDKSGSTPEST